MICVFLPVGREITGAMLFLAKQSAHEDLLSVCDTSETDQQKGEELWKQSQNPSQAKKRDWKI